jgi:excisionase family DNA binding protein
MHRLIKSGKIPAINLGERLTRVSRAHIEAMFPAIEIPEPSATPIYKTDYKPEECYTIGEISKKFGVSLGTVDKTIRKRSIPKKQIGKYVYVPKEQIDNIFNPNNITN